MAKRCNSKTGCNYARASWWKDTLGTNFISPSSGSSTPDLGLYVSAAGDGVGTQADPFGPSEFQAALATTPEGSTIYFKKGDTFILGELSVPADNLTFSTYGSGDDPIIIGSISLSAATWTSEASGRWSTPLASAPLWVTKDGVASRQAESAWIPASAGSTATTTTGATATLNPINTTQSLVGAKIRQKEFNFRLSYEATITNYNTGSGVITHTGGNFAGGATGMPFKLYGQLQFCTTEGDWFYDSSAQKLYIKSTATPAGTNIRYITKNCAFDTTDRTGITIEGLTLTQYYREAVLAHDSTVTIDECTISNCRTNGVLLSGNSTQATITNNTITKCGLNGIHVGAISTSTISNNTIHTIGEESNIGWPIDTDWIKTGGCAIAHFWESTEAVTQPDDIDMDYNTMYDLGYMGILAIGDDHNIRYNIVHDFCERWNDGGGIYTIHRNTLGTSTKNVNIQSNIVYNGQGSKEGIVNSDLIHAEGIYIDNGCELITVTGNTVYNCTDFGILCNWDTRMSTITNNVVYGNHSSQIMFRQDTDIGDSPVFQNNDGNILTGNTIVSVGPSQYCVEVQSYQGNDNYNPFSNGGGSDSNHYIRPYSTTINLHRATSVTAYTVGTWRTKFSDDASSVERVNLYTHANPDNVVLATNMTNATVTVNPGAGFLDTDNNSLSSFDLAAYSSRIYRRQTEVTYSLLLDNFTAANGTNLSGRTPPTGPIPTIGAGTHTVVGNRWSSSPGGTVMWNLGTTNVKFTYSLQVSSLTDGFNTYARYTNDNNRLVIAISSSYIMTLFEFNASGSATNSWTTSMPFLINTEYYITIVTNGSNVKVYVDNMLMLDVTTALTTGNSFGALGTLTATKDYVIAV
jgi:hypothetical protein